MLYMHCNEDVSPPQERERERERGREGERERERERERSPLPDMNSMQEKESGVEYVIKKAEREEDERGRKD